MNIIKNIFILILIFYKKLILNCKNLLEIRGNFIINELIINSDYLNLININREIRKLIINN